MNHLLKAPLLDRRAAGVPVRYVRNRVPEKQKLFQEDNGLPVYLKGGPSDFLMYRATMTLTALGT
ncbi:hypothetical protein D9O29_24295, partial [Pantoea vagans]